MTSLPPADPDKTTAVLRPDQQARVLALKEARGVLVARSGPFTASAASTKDLIHVARYIITGEDA